MRHLNKKMLRVVYILLLSALMMFSAMAAGTESQSDLRVYSTEESGEPAVTEEGYISGETEARSYRAADTFTAGDKALELIKEFEGFRSTPYQDSNGLAIGYGSSYAKAQEKFPGCSSITVEQALELVRDDLSIVENTLNAYLDRYEIDVNQNQFDALVDFTYNVGTGWVYSQNSDGTPYKIRAMLEGNPAEWTEERAQEAFGTWVKANGVVLQGLVRRRAAEATLFVTPCASDGNTTEGAYEDLPADAWYVDYVLEAYDRGLMQGLGNGVFAPETNMTRAQMVQALANFADVDLSAYTGSSFTDVPADQWYAPAVAWAAEQGVINGMGDGTFRPEEPIKREHICNIVARYLRSIGVAAGDAVEPFRDDAEIASEAMENVYYCASLGLVNGIGDNRFAPGEMASRAQVAKILVCMDRLLEE